MTKKSVIHSGAIARFFSATVLKELAKKGCSPTLARLLRESSLDIDANSSEAISSIFEPAFNILKQRMHRHEYIYKAALTQKVLLGTHSLQTASMLTEFRIGKCKADVVILNGTGTVYEIKSERDSLSRLMQQVHAYAKVFAKVNVIVGENHLEEVHTALPDYIGIQVLSQRYSIHEVRKANEDAGRTDPAAIFEAINQKEAELILKAAGQEIPNVPNTKRYTVLRELFIELDPEFAHRSMVDILKKTRNLQPLQSMLKEIPPSLYAASLSIKLQKKDRFRLVEALNTPIYNAVSWG